MKRISLIPVLLVLLLVLVGCKCDNSDHYSTPNITPSSSGVTQSSTLDRIDAPSVSAGGKYTMLCTFRQNAVYSDGEYGMETDWDMKSWYDFTVKETEEGFHLDFTVARRNYVYGYNGEKTVVFDTADKETKNADTKIYFDIIGHGFTVDLDKELKIVSVGGTKKLYSEVEGAKELLGEAEIRAVAEELLLLLPEEITKDTELTHFQTVDKETNMEMKYGVSNISDSMISFRMSPVSEYGLPESEAEENYSLEYIGADDYNGSLSIMTNDRFLQSSSNSITYYSVMKLGDGMGVTQILNGVTTVTDSCQVTAAE